MNLNPCHRCFYSGFVMLLVVLFSGGCSEDILPGNTPEKQAITVKTAIAVAATATQPVFYEAVGTTAPEIGATVSAQVMGQVESVRFEEGQQVKQGDPLVIIDAEKVSAGLDQAQAGLKAARQTKMAAEASQHSALAATNLAEATYKRYKALLETESASRQEFDQVEAAWKQASAALEQSRFMNQAAQQQVRQAEAALAAAQSAFYDTIVRAPYDAVVTTKLVEPGDLAAPGTPLFKLEKAGAFEARLILPEAHIGAVSIGDQVPVLIESLGTAPVMGRIKSIDLAADPASRSFQVRVALPITEGLHSGMFARVKIPIGEAGMILIPQTAVIRHGALEGLFIVDGQHIVRFHLIRTGRSIGEKIEVISGLTNGDAYVVHPDHRIRVGVKAVQ